MRKVVCVEDDDVGDEDVCLGGIRVLKFFVWFLGGEVVFEEVEDIVCSSYRRLEMSSRGLWLSFFIFRK